jgi:hypothetical protein
MLSIIITILWQHILKSPYLGLNHKWSNYAPNAVLRHTLWNAVTSAIDFRDAGTATTESATTGIQHTK